MTIHTGIDQGAEDCQRQAQAGAPHEPRRQHGTEQESEMNASNQMNTRFGRLAAVMAAVAALSTLGACASKGSASMGFGGISASAPGSLGEGAAGGGRDGGGDEADGGGERHGTSRNGADRACPGCPGHGSHALRYVAGDRPAQRDPLGGERGERVERRPARVVRGVHELLVDDLERAIEAAKAMGLNIAGVDILRSNHGPLVMEVNSSPGLAGIEETTGKDVAGVLRKRSLADVTWRGRKRA